MEKLKQELKQVVVLKLPDWNKGFELYVDASKVALGYSLAQEGRPVACGIVWEIKSYWL